MGSPSPHEGPARESNVPRHLRAMHRLLEILRKRDSRHSWMADADAKSGKCGDRNSEDADWSCGTDRTRRDPERGKDDRAPLRSARTPWAAKRGREERHWPSDLG